MAAEFSQTVSARHLILTHFSQRYKGEGEGSLEPGEEEEDVGMLLREAREALSHTSTLVSVAHDLKVFTIPAPPQN